jgi:cyclophilin family peptidyl-prolyl cis-trans isomerase
MKRHVPKDILECDSPMLKTPPVDLLKQAQNQTAKRSAWTLCTVIPRINAALEMYKQRFCAEGYNRDKTVRLHPSEQCTDRRRTMSHKADGSCWSFAHEELPTINIPEWFADESRVVTVECNSTKGVFEIDVHPEWAPLGAARFIELVDLEYWTDMPLFRKNWWITQFGTRSQVRESHKSHKLTEVRIRDDPHLKMNNGRLFDRAVSYAGGGPDTRTAGIFIVHNISDQPIGGSPWEVPFGIVTKGMDVVRRWYSGYGEPKRGDQNEHGVDVQILYREGNEYLHKNFPKLDYINSCTVLRRPAAAATPPSKGLAQRPRPKQLPANLPAADDIHIIFTTDCGRYQMWQTMVLVNTAKLAKQVGHITQIVSGCEGDRSKEAMHERLADDTFHVHFAPTYVPPTEDKYPPYNRPNGIQHWLHHSKRRIVESVIAVIDPDQLFVMPLEVNRHREFNASGMLYSGKLPLSEVNDIVVEGHAVAQQYGLGDGWIKWDRAKICGSESACTKVTSAEAWEHYSIGPPWIMHRNDLVKVAEQWASFLPEVRRQYHELLAEQYTYSLASAHHSLPSIRLDHYMVSGVDGWGEGWEWVDKMEGDVCESEGKLPAGQQVPTFIHHCQNYNAGVVSDHSTLAC